MLQYPHVNDSVQMYTLYLTVVDNTAGKKNKKTQIKKVNILHFYRKG